MISPNTIQQITSRIDIIDIINDFIKLKKRGSNYLGLCPFHNEKTPSFTVSPSKEIYKCFGCGRSGNSISFIMEHEKYTYVEALKWLAKRYNIEIEETVVSNEVREQQQISESLYIINGFAQKFLSNNLLNHEEGQSIALSYLHERGFKNEIIEKFQIGYSLNSINHLSAEFITQQFNPEIAVKSGLSAFRNDELVDNYRGRIIFPVHNNSGKILGFGARIIGKNDKAPKYINTPENELYVKSKILYGLYFSRYGIDKQNECLLVEGYTDVVSLHQAGIENVVASGGTSLTPDQLRLIKKYTNNLTIIYDGDSAGIKAAMRGVDLALEESLNVKLVLIPDNEDPDSYVRKIGADEFREFINNTKKDFILFQLEILLQDAGNDTYKKSEVVNQIAETLSKINKAEDFTKQQDYIKQCAALIKIEEAGLTNLVNKFKRDRIVKEEKKLSFNEANVILNDSQITENENTGLQLLYQDELQEQNLIRALLEHGLKPYDEEHTLADYIFTEMEYFEFDNRDYEFVFEEFRTQYLQQQNPGFKSFLYHPSEKIRNIVIGLNINPHELSNWDKHIEGLNLNNRDVSFEDVVKSLNYFKLRKIKKWFEKNQEDIANAQSLEEQFNLMEVHKQLKEKEIEITKLLGTVILK